MTSFVSIIAGSRNDEDFLEPAFAVFRDFSITFEFKVLSAHRNTERLFEYIEDADARGVSIYLTAAGFSAALPGVVAAKTLRPVLGIPVPVGPLQGLMLCLPSCSCRAAFPWPACRSVATAPRTPLSSPRTSWPYTTTRSRDTLRRSATR